MSSLMNSFVLNTFIGSDIVLGIRKTREINKILKPY